MTRATGSAPTFLCLSTVLPDFGIDFHSTYTGPSDADTRITELLLAGRVAHSIARACAHEELPVVSGRRRCLLDHLARLRERLEQRSGLDTRIELEDETLVAGPPPTPLYRGARGVADVMSALPVWEDATTAGAEHLRKHPQPFPR